MIDTVPSGTTLVPPVKPHPAGYIADWRMLNHANAARKWLTGPVSRIMLGKRAHTEASEMITGLLDRLTPRGEKLTVRPPVGSVVRLIRSSSYLFEYHGASLGTLGRITRHSGNHPEDNGVMVDWGDGVEVRSDLDELQLELS